MTERYRVPRADVKEGTVLIADGGFTCMDAESVLRVRQNDNGELFVPCKHGNGHLLSGQIDGEDFIGFKAYDHFKAH